MSTARELRLGLGDRRGELLTEINIALLDAMAGDIDRGLASARRSLAGFESAGDQVGMGAALTILGAVELLSGETRAAREMYAPGSGATRALAAARRLVAADDGRAVQRAGRPTPGSSRDRQGSSDLRPA